MATRTKEIRIPVGRLKAGDRVVHEYRTIGHVIEHKANGQTWEEYELCMDILNPVLFQQAKSCAIPGSSFCYGKRFDLPRRAPARSAPPSEGDVPHGGGGAEGAETGTAGYEPGCED